MTFYKPLDLQHLLINTLSGDTLIFTIISVIAIAAASAYFRMPNSTTLLMIALFSIIMSSYIGTWLLVPVILIVGMIVFWTLSKQWE